MTDDSELLRRYAQEKSESAFAELVQRKAGLVYSAALRQVGGDMLLAQDVTQTVFIDLARKAGPVSSRPVLTSWLYVSTRFAALKALRAKRRREARELEAQRMHDVDTAADREADWSKLRPLIDDAMCELPERDRSAILMRYFDGKPFAEMAASLGIGESSARVKTERALEKLRGKLLVRGVTSTTAALALAITTHAVAAPPAAFVSTLAGTVIAQSAVLGAGGVGLTLKLYQLAAMKKLQTGIAALLAVGATTFASYDVDEHARARAFFIYLVCFGVGLMFALISAIFGHMGFGHAEIGHGDLGHGGDAGGTHGHAEAGVGDHDMPGFAHIGPTTIATFVTAFGGIGMILSHVDSVHRVSGFIAAAGALAIAAAVGWFFALVFRVTQGSSEGRVSSLVGHTATVITPIPAAGVGEIAYVQGGSRYSAPARTVEGVSVTSGSTVKIVRIVGAQFYVNATALNG